jgi:putative PIN family toxin of toxin-antitoxin system
VSASPKRVVLDTNIVVRAFINPHSHSGRVLRACQDRRVVPLLSTAVLNEYRAIISRPSLVERYPELDRPEIGVALERLLYVSDFYRRIRVHFSFPRDPKDAALIELAMTGRTTRPNALGSGFRVWKSSQ